MICPGCGAENPDSASYCGLCSKVFTPAQEPPTDYYSPDPYAPEFSASDYYQTLDRYGSDRGGRSVSLAGLKSFLVMLLVLAVLAMGGYLAYRYFFSTTTHSSTHSGLSVSYPRGWKKVEVADYEAMGVLSVDSADASDINELIVADKVPGETKYVLVAMSIQGEMPAWEVQKYELMESMRAEFFDPSEGATAGAMDIKEATVGGASALIFKGNGTTDNIPVEGRFVAAPKGGYFYVVLLMSTDSAAKVDKCWDKIQGSLKF